MAVPLVACPTCKRQTRFAPDNLWRPFCSERCRQIDLGAWASEQFRVAAESQDEDNPPVAPVNTPSPPERH